KVRPLARFRSAPVRSESKTWPETFGNGVSITTSFTGQERKQIRAAQPLEPSAFIAVAVGNRASAVCAQPFAAQTCPVFPATISVFALFANATDRNWIPKSGDRMAKKSPEFLRGL